MRSEPAMLSVQDSFRLQRVAVKARDQKSSRVVSIQFSILMRSLFNVFLAIKSNTAKVIGKRIIQSRLALETGS